MESPFVPDEGTKRCSGCKEIQPLDAFGKNKAKPDGLQAQCKSCFKVINQASYARNKEALRADRGVASEKVRARNRRFVFDFLLENPCVDCGESDPVVLQFDHQGNKIASIANLIAAASLKRLSDEMVKCEVVCANCHARRTARTFGWWKLTAASPRSSEEEQLAFN